MRCRREWVWRLILMSLAVTLVLPVRAEAALPPPPPPPPSIPLPPPAPSGEGGAYIVLRAAFAPDWAWSQAKWQDLWTVVEWQDERGLWHAVEGWRGGLDDVQVYAIGSQLHASAEVIGQKTWWVGRANLGQGPFRWVVTWDNRRVKSEPFTLPSYNGQTLQVEVTLK